MLNKRLRGEKVELAEFEIGALSTHLNFVPGVEAIARLLLK